MKENHNLKELQEIAKRLRLHVVDMITPSGQGYVQQSLGNADAITRAATAVIQRKKSK